MRDKSERFAKGYSGNADTNRIYGQNLPLQRDV